MRKIAVLLSVCAILCYSAVFAYADEDSTMVWGRYGRADNVYSQVSTEEKVVALTFDDGPHPKYTEEILDILKSNYKWNEQTMFDPPDKHRSIEISWALGSSPMTLKILKDWIVIWNEKEIDINEYEDN